MPPTALPCTSSPRSTGTCSTSAAGTISTWSSPSDLVYEGLTHTTGSIAEKVALWTSEDGIKRHPLAHHITNPVVTEVADGTVRMICKGIMIRAEVAPVSIIYEDIAVRTEQGWRIAYRKATNRTEQALAAG